MLPSQDRRKPSAPVRVEHFREHWYQDFLRALKCSEHGQQVLRDFMPTCDFRAVGKAAMLHLLNPQCLNRVRKHRRFVVASDLRAQARELSADIAALPRVFTQFTDLDSFAKSPQFNDLVTIHRKNEELERTKAALAKIPRAFSTKRIGMFENYEYLFLTREYLAHKSGRVPRTKQLAVIVRAGQAALGRRQKHHFIDADTLSRNLRNFEDNNPEFCALAKGPAAVEVIESLPHGNPAIKY